MTELERLASARALFGFSQLLLGNWVAQEVVVIVTPRTEYTRGGWLGHPRDKAPKTPVHANVVEEVSPGLGARASQILETPLYWYGTTSLTHTGTLGWASGFRALAEGELGAGC